MGHVVVDLVYFGLLSPLLFWFSAKYRKDLREYMSHYS